MNPLGAKPSLFISYAHKDGMDFTRRLAFALGLYLDVFWDLRLPAGEFQSELRREIENRDFFLLVMSPYSLRGTGWFNLQDGWCRKELKHAQKHQKRIALAKIYPDSGHPLEKKLSDKYTYGDFASDFEVGFRRITQEFLGNPYSSWEALPSQKDNELMERIKDGKIPALITKEFIDWVIIEKFWVTAIEYAATRGHASAKSPRTLKGVLFAGSSLIEKFVEQRDMLGAQKTLAVMNLVRANLDRLTSSTDEEHAIVGQIAYEIIKNTKELLIGDLIAGGEQSKAIDLLANFDFDVAEKLRELIQIHARRSRYLY